MALPLRKKLKLMKLTSSNLRPKSEIFDWHEKDLHKAFKPEAKTKKLRPSKIRGGTDEHDTLKAA